jgi:hypothetical protein
MLCFSAAVVIMELNLDIVVERVEVGDIIFNKTNMYHYVFIQ